jgi:hypothetical protein
LKSFPTEVGGFKPDFWKVKLWVFIKTGVMQRSHLNINI